MVTTKSGIITPIASGCNDSTVTITRYWDGYPVRGFYLIFSGCKKFITRVSVSIVIEVAIITYQGKFIIALHTLVLVSQRIEGGVKL